MSRTAFTEADRLPGDDPAVLDLQLAETVALLESVDWREAPGISATTAATFARQVQAARADLEADR